MQNNRITDTRTPKGQNNYKDWEKRVILAVDGQGITAEMLSGILDRTASSITHAAAKIGSSLRSKK